MQDDLITTATFIPPAPDSDTSGGKRLMSLDALRGFDMFWIIGGEWMFLGLAKGSGCQWLQALTVQFHHVEWEGFRFIDLVMPLFLFIVGTAMPFSMAKRQLRGDSKGKLYRHVTVRVAVLFVLGMVAQGRLLEFDLARLHIYSNTLQAIAVGYLIAEVIMLNLNVRRQMAATGGLLVLFWAMMKWVPVPGHGAGVLTADGNLAIYIDEMVLGRFRDGTNYTWILSGLTFGATTMLGALAGQLLRSDRGRATKVLVLLGTGMSSLAAGWIWGQFSPIVKHVWTSSFVLYSGGICLLLLGVFYLVIDVWGWRRWAFGFVVIGTNAIAVYMVTQLFDFRTAADILIGGLSKWTGQWQDLVRAGVGFGIIWSILWWMYRKRSFVKI